METIKNEQIFQDQPDQDSEVEVIAPTTEHGPVIDVEETVIQLDDKSLLMAQALVSYTASLISELNVQKYFETTMEFKRFFESKLRQMFFIFFGDDVLVDLDINVSSEGTITVDFQMAQGELVVTNTRLAVTSFVKVQ